jgi:hypothetical protein
LIARISRAILRRAERWHTRVGYFQDRIGYDGITNGPAWLTLRPLPETAIICGSAPSLIVEFEEARTRRAAAFVIAVNQAAQLIAADAIFTQHPEKAARFRGLSRNPNAEVHIGKLRRFARGYPVSVYWPDCVQGVTSGGSAIHAACMMGFSEIILCGLPMSGGDGYAAGLQESGAEPRFGLESADSDYVRSYSDCFERFVVDHRDLLQPVRSCGGWTRELFGGPSWDVKQAGD